MNTQEFKTRTEIIPRNNMGDEKTWVIALDIGYSGTKIFAPNKIAVFPSYAKPYRSIGNIGQLPDDFISYKDLDTGEEWLVGKLAQEDATLSSSNDSEEALYGRQRYYDPMFLVTTRVGLGIALLGNEIGSYKEGQTIRVQTGLPPKYRDDARDLREVISGNHNFSIRIGNGPEHPFQINIDAKNVGIIEQPLGSLYSVSIGNDHEFVPASNLYLDRSLLVFDAGFGTFDLFFIQSHQIKNSETFANLGMKQVFMQTADAIMEKYGVSVSIADMQKYLASGKVRKFDRRNLTTEDVDFSDLLEQAVRDVALAAIDKMNQVYPLHEIDYLIITGGTGAAWREIIREKLKGMQTLQILDGNMNDTDLPFIYANVRGYYQYLSKKVVMERSRKS